MADLGKDNAPSAPQAHPERNASPLPAERIETRILMIRGHRGMIDADLAELYGVTTGALNQAVKRNAERFPEDFAFRLTPGTDPYARWCDRESGRPPTYVDYSTAVRRREVSRR